MARLNVGDKMPDITFSTPYEQGRTLSETVSRVKGKTALVFLRYYGCTLCQYNIHVFMTEHEKIAATGGQMLVVLQSDPGKLAAQVEKGKLPFDIICDPDQAIYTLLDIKPAGSKEEMRDGTTAAKIAALKAKVPVEYTHGEYEGNEFQLPATFVVEPDLTVTYAGYHKTIGDTPSPDELAALLK